MKNNKNQHQQTQKQQQDIMDNIIF